MRSTIVSVKANEIQSNRGYPAVEAIVKTENGAVGRAICVAGGSVGTHEIPFAYDGGDKWRGKGVMRAVDAVNDVIAPAIVGMDATKQIQVDDVMLRIGKDVLGGNATGAVSAAVLKAGAAALGIPLYAHIGGASAYMLPVPGEACLSGSDRYGKHRKRASGKPSFCFTAYGFESFAEASYALWDISDRWASTLLAKYGNEFRGRVAPAIPAGVVKSDIELWDLMTETINKYGYENRIGLQVDIAADTYFNKETQKFEGLFDSTPRSMDEMFEFLISMPKKWPFIVIEDPLGEDDYEMTGKFTSQVDIQVTGDDLFTTNPARVLEGIKYGAANTVLLKVNQIGTITEAFDMVSLAYQNGYAVMPCSSRGEGVDIADYSVGLKVGSVRESGVGDIANRFIEIEKELGSRAKFAGIHGLKGSRFALK
jgi:enolase